MFYLNLFGLNTISGKLATVLSSREDLKIRIIGNTAQSESFSSHQELQDNNVEVLVVDNLGELDLDRENGVDCFNLSIGAPWIFTASQIEELPGQPLCNLHGTHLPKDRGGTVFSWQILSDRRTGICVLHMMSDRIDAGGVVRYKEYLYPDHCRIPIDYIEVYEEQNVNFVANCIREWIAGDFKIESIGDQPEYLSTYWPRLRADSNAWIDWSWNGKEIELFIRAFDSPYPGSRTVHRGRRVIFRGAYFQPTDGKHHPFQYGLVFRKNSEWIVIAVEGGELLIKEVLDESGQDVMDQIRTGDRFQTFQQELDASKVRVVKTKDGLRNQKDI